MKNKLITSIALGLMAATSAHAVINITISDAGNSQIRLEYSGGNVLGEPFIDAFIRYSNQSDNLFDPNLTIDGGPVGSILISVDGGTAFAPSEIEMLGSSGSIGYDYLGARAPINGSNSISVTGSTILSADFSNFTVGSASVSSPVGPIYLTVVPEPSQYTLVTGAAAAALLCMRRRTK